VTDPGRAIEAPRGSVAPGQPPASPDFQALYRAHVGYVWNALRRLGVARGELEDLTQETFLRAFRNHASFDPSRPLRPWLFAIAARTAVDFRRAARHGREVLEAAPDAAHEVPGADEDLAAAQQRRLLRELIDGLDDDRRAVFVMHECLGHTAVEIAQALDIPMNTAYSRLRLARADFKALLAKRLEAVPP